MTGLLATLAVAGCRTTTEPDPNAAVERFTRNARPPRDFAVSIYQDDSRQWVVVNGNRVRPGQRLQSSFISPPGMTLPLISAEGPRGPVSVLIDPGAPRSWTAMDRQAQLDLRPIAPPVLLQDPVHVVDNRQGVLCLAPLLKIDRTEIEALLLYARPVPGSLWPISRNALANNAAAVLGFDFLRVFSWIQWDFQGRMIVASSTDIYQPDPARLVATLPLEARAEAMTTRALLDGKPKTVVLDLAGDYEVAMDDPPMALIRQLTMDNAVLRDVRATAAKDLGLGRTELVRLGLRLLSRFTVTLDNHSNQIYLEIPRHAGEPGS
jgi:hypothetical protein